MKQKYKKKMFAGESTPTKREVAFLEALDVSVADTSLPLFNAYTSVVKHIIENAPHRPDLDELDRLLSAVDFVPDADQRKTSLAAQKMCESFGEHLESLTGIDQKPEQFIKVSVLGFAAKALEQLSQGEFDEARHTMWQARERVLCTQLKDKLNVEWEEQQLKKQVKKSSKKSEDAIVVRLSGGPNRAKFEGFKNRQEVAAFLKSKNKTGRPLVFVTSSVVAVTYIVFPDHVAGPSASAAKSGRGKAVAYSYSQFLEKIKQPL